MQIETLLLIVLSGVLALFLALFQYKYKSKYKGKLSLWFVFLRFISLFCIFLLLVNPKFSQIQLFTEKPSLAIVIDNSNSIKYLKQNKNADSVIDILTKHPKLNERFKIETFSFSKTLKNSDVIDYQSIGSNIDRALIEVSNMYKNEVAPIILISDGNQTYGNDYSVSNKYKQPVYPIILGDTITHTDIKIQQLNVNRYAFLKNNFPVEAILVYQGNNAISTNFSIVNGKNTLISKTIQLSKNNNSKIINITLPANSAGLERYIAKIKPLKNEKNTVNNSKNFAVEVINQKTNIALVSDISHPDLGALKKSIESNKQRAVSIVKPTEILSKINNYQLFIFYQPTSRFIPLYKLIKSNKNIFTIIGTKTNLNIVNKNSKFKYDITRQTEEYQAKLNQNYPSFLVEDIGFETFPPLTAPFGNVVFDGPVNTILEKRLLGISNTQPLLSTFEIGDKREATLFGENIWRWRAQSYLDTESFIAFDNFMGKLIQYLALSRKKSRLNLDYQSFYSGSNNVIIKAQAFDKNYEFDARQTLELILRNAETNETKVLPLLLKNFNYQVDLSGLTAGQYNFTVITKSEKISKSGRFEVLDYNIEQQFLNADVLKLQKVAEHTNGKSFFLNTINDLITELSLNESYKPIQKSNKNTIPLIDWKYLLVIIILSLSVEWFLRKYNGLI